MGVHGYVLVFSLTSRHSFERIVQVNDMLLNTLGDAPDVPRVLVGSMKDLATNDQRQVSQSVRRCGVLDNVVPTHLSLSVVQFFNINV